MSSIFVIEQDLLRIFQTIEDNDGEITDELYEEMLITQEDLKKKLKGYHAMVQRWEAEVATCKAEIKRLQAIAKTKENRIEKLKNIMLDAVEKFGQDGKTNKFIELDTVRLFTRAATSVNIDENRTKIFIDEFERYGRELVEQGILEDSQQVDLLGVLDAMNANIRAEQGENYEPYTLADLTNLKLNFSTTLEVSDLLKTSTDVLSTYTKNRIYSTLSDSTSKTDWGKRISISNPEDNMSVPTVAWEVKKNSLTIK